MVIGVFRPCPVCGEIHEIPDARSFDRAKMGCDRALKVRLSARVAPPPQLPVVPDNGSGFQPNPGEQLYVGNPGDRVYDNGQ